MSMSQATPVIDHEGGAANDVATERRFRLERLAAAFRLLARFDVVDGAAGHITARDPEHPSCFWVNPAGKHFSRIRVSDLMMIDEEAHIVEGEGRLNQAAFAIHSRIHRARPDVIAAAHAHSLYGKAWSALGRLLDPLTQDACAFYEDHAVFADYTGVVFDEHEGDRIAVALQDGKACLLRNHGILTVGGSVEEATWWYLAMDRACAVQLLAEAAGRPILIEPASARLTAQQVGSPEAAKVNFDSLWDVLVEEEPDFLD
jgi:ribulose-5-phosphate 4-epimerase/fuculose-1-phosphate aldolase